MKKNLKPLILGPAASLLSSLALHAADTASWAIHAINTGADNKVTFITRAKDDTTGYVSTPKVELYNALSGTYPAHHGHDLVRR